MRELTQTSFKIQNVDI